MQHFSETRNIKKHWWSSGKTLGEYYFEPEWQEKSINQRTRNPFCKYCKRRATEVHHKRYWRWAWSWTKLRLVKKPIFYHERRWHLESVCQRCHQQL